MPAIYPKIRNMSPLFLVADLEQSLDFYIQQLGFAIDFRYQDFYAGILKDGYSIHLKAGYTEPGERGDGHIDITFAVDDIEELFEAIKESQVTIVQPLRQMPYGQEFYIADPNGYILAFLE
jgi:predicted enzyme related to lactoylglutathione lyase